MSNSISIRVGDTDIVIRLGAGMADIALMVDGGEQAVSSLTDDSNMLLSLRALVRSFEAAIAPKVSAS